MVVAVDFDGTVVTHEYPAIGQELPGAAECLRKLVAQGHKLILYTMRSGEHLDEAVQWFDNRGIPLWGVNENRGQKHWTTSPKIYANLYIDDAALGVPAVYDKGSGRNAVDWAGVERMLEKSNIIVEEIITE